MTKSDQILAYMQLTCLYKRISSREDVSATSMEPLFGDLPQWETPSNEGLM